MSARCVEQGVDCVPGQVSSKFVCVLIVILFLFLRVVVEPQRSIRGTRLLSRAGILGHRLSANPHGGTMRTPVTPSELSSEEDPDLISFASHVRTPGANTSSGCIERN